MPGLFPIRCSSPRGQPRTKPQLVYPRAYWPTCQELSHLLFLDIWFSLGQHVAIYRLVQSRQSLPLMHHFKMVLATAVAAWSHVAACATCNYSGLQAQLSSSAQIYCSSSPQWASETSRWSALDEPQPNVVVVPGTEHDVSVTVSLCPANDLEFTVDIAMIGEICKLPEHALLGIQWRPRINHHPRPNEVWH